MKENLKLVVNKELHIRL